jgi:hypothetical protein
LLFERGKLTGAAHIDSATSSLLCAEGFRRSDFVS